MLSMLGNKKARNTFSVSGQNLCDKVNYLNICIILKFLFALKR
jgi:hypothetical protein